MIHPVNLFHGFHLSVILELHLIRFLYHGNDVIAQIFDG